MLRHERQAVTFQRDHGERFRRDLGSTRENASPARTDHFIVTSSPAESVRDPIPRRYNRCSDATAPATPTSASAGPACRRTACPYGPHSGAGARVSRAAWKAPTLRRMRARHRSTELGSRAARLGGSRRSVAVERISRARDARPAPRGRPEGEVDRPRVHRPRDRKRGPLLGGRELAAHAGVNWVGARGRRRARPNPH